MTLQITRKNPIYQRKKLKRAIFTFIGICLTWFLLHTAYVMFDGLRDHLQPVDLAVVLGNKVEVTGVPSPMLTARLERTVELYQQGYFKKVLVSGGLGKEGYDEALVMKDYLIQRGVPEAVILVDSEGDNTYKTAANTAALMEGTDFNSIMVISQYFHITRIKLAFSKVGIQVDAWAHGYYFSLRDVYSLIREFAGYYVYWLRY